MNLYWFSTEEGEVWEVIAAQSEEKAWQLLTEKDSVIVEDTRKKFALDAYTMLDGTKEGEVACIFPREVNFYIKEEPGGQVSIVPDY